MKNSQLSDDEFLAAFESATLRDFHHIDHVRAAWLYLWRLPFPAASRRMAESVRRFADKHGALQKYHETITRAWMILVWDALEENRQAGNEGTLSTEAGPDAGLCAEPASHATHGFDAFARAHSELLDVRALDRFYSPQLLDSPSARARFVPPDCSPLPGFPYTP